MTKRSSKASRMNAGNRVVDSSSKSARVNAGGRLIGGSSDSRRGLVEVVVDTSSDSRHHPVDAVIDSSSDSPSRIKKANELKRRYGASTFPNWNDTRLDPARSQLGLSLTAEIQENLDANPARLDELVAIRDIDDFQVSVRARRFELPAERDHRRKQRAKDERRERRLRRLKVVSASLGLIAYCVGMAAAGVMLPVPEEFVFIGLAVPVVIAVLAVAKRLLLPSPPPPQAVLKDLTPEALMMQRFLDIADGIYATGAWRSDVAGSLDLDVEQQDIGDQLRQMEALSASIESFTASNDNVLVHALTKERARLASVRMSMVDRLAALDRYRVSLEQVDVDTERAAKFSKVDQITSAIDMLEVGRASSEFSIGHTTRASEQLDQSIRTSRQMLEEFRGHH